jgi:peptide/nickel transport system ATP-binding protein
VTHQPGDDHSLLEVRDLRMHYRAGHAASRRTASWVKALDGISFTIARGETLGLVGESGCGKSTTGRLVAKLAEPTAGSIRFDGRDITSMGRTHLQQVRRELQMIFQDPYSALNPRHTVGSIIAAPLRIQKIKTANGVTAEVQRLMERVGLKPEHYSRYPQEFSGGQRQRIGIARAIALKPKLIVCDEPVSALDVSVQAQVVNLLADLQREFHTAYLFIAHDLSIVRHISNRIAVMYLGRIMELASCDDLYEAPQHPYTRALLSAVPVADPRQAATRERTLLQGDLPSPLDPPTGCVFHTRCPKYLRMLSDNDRKRCREQIPVAQVTRPGHQVACHFPEMVPARPPVPAIARRNAPIERDLGGGFSERHSPYR